MSSPWMKITTPEPINLQNIISEELTKKLIESRLNKTDSTASPELLNKKEDVNISFSSDTNALNLDDSDGETEDFNDLSEEWNEYDGALEYYYEIPPSGRTNIQKSAHKSLVQPIKFKPTDDTDSNMKILEFKNYLKSSPNDAKRGAARSVCDKNGNFAYYIYSKEYNAKYLPTDTINICVEDGNDDCKMTIYNLDGKSTSLLFKMIDRKFIERVNYTISSNKSMLVVHVSMGPECKDQKECVVKIFKPKLTEKEEQNVSKTLPIHPDAQKDVLLLQRLHNAKILCPKIIHVEENILITSFIGSDQIFAPRLRFAVLSEKEKLAAYNQVLKYTNDLYTKCNLVYRDLSAGDIVWRKSVYFINIEKMIESSHENALSFLYRNCQKITKIFKKQNMPNVATASKIFEDITGYKFKDKSALKELQDHNKLNTETT